MGNDRLLTPEEQEKVERDFIKDCSSANMVALGRGHWDVIVPTMLEAQDAKTASIKDAECQERGERIFKEIEDKVLVKLYFAYKADISHSTWEALKKKALK